MPPRKGKREPQPFNMAEALRLAGEQLLKQSKTPNILGYQPHEKQLVFHSNEKHGRLFIGGNRSGKSFAGVAEDIWWLTGTHPHLKDIPKPPVRGRVIGVDFDHGVGQILIPLYKRLMPPDYLKNGSWDESYHKAEHQLELTNGSTLEFMSYDQDTDKFAGTSRHFIHFDEEPPQHIFNENMMRLMDTDGNYWITMTPVEGMTWLYDELYEPAKEGRKDDLFILEVNTKDNPHIKEKARERVFAGLEEQERKAREEGQFIDVGGKIFKQFTEPSHVIEPIVPPKSWQWFMSVDSGWNNPTAILWHAVSPDNTIITFGEHYASEMTVEEHVRVINEKETFWGKTADIRTGDPAMRQTREGTGTSVQQEYALRGIYLALEGVPTGPGSVAVGIGRMQQYFKVNPVTKKPRWMITEDCSNFIRELKRLRWATYSSKKIAYENNAQEKIHKKDDHACDSARYFITLMPDLTPDDLEGSKLEIAKSGGIVRYDELVNQMHRIAQEQPDKLQFVEDTPAATQWRIVEEFDSLTQ